MKIFFLRNSLNTNMELEKIDKKKRDTEDLHPVEENHNVDHLTKIIGVFGPFHAMVYTAIGKNTAD